MSSAHFGFICVLININLFIIIYFWVGFVYLCLFCEKMYEMKEGKERIWDLSGYPNKGLKILSLFDCFGI